MENNTVRKAGLKMKKSSNEEMITEWLRDNEKAVSSLAGYTAITNAEWLKLEQARLTARGVVTLIITHPENKNIHALMRVPAEVKRHG
jgi:hypothetical protein